MFDLFKLLADSDPLEPIRYKITSQLELFGITNKQELEALNNIVDVEFGDYVGNTVFFGSWPADFQPMPWFFNPAIEPNEELSSTNQKKVYEILAHYSAAAALLENVISNDAPLEALATIARHFFHAGKIEGEMGSRFFDGVEKAKRKKDARRGGKAKSDVYEKAKDIIRDFLQDAKYTPTPNTHIAKLLCDQIQAKLGSQRLTEENKLKKIAEWVGQIKKELGL